MVLTHETTRMSRTDEVHRITENVYKVSDLLLDRNQYSGLFGRENLSVILGVFIRNEALFIIRSRNQIK